MHSTVIVEAVGRAAQRVRLLFTPKLDGDPLLLRVGSVDLEISNRGTSAPELRRQFYEYRGVPKGVAPAGSSSAHAYERFECRGRSNTSRLRKRIIVQP